LIRAIEPVNDGENWQSEWKLMIENRNKIHRMKYRTNLKQHFITSFCAGPGKLCEAFNITREEFDGIDLSDENSILYVEIPVLLDPALDEKLNNVRNEPLDNIAATPRINISYAGEEWALKLLRYCMVNKIDYLSFPLGAVLSYKNPQMWVKKQDEGLNATTPGAPTDYNDYRSIVQILGKKT